eukprot:3304859-Pleurochrysis_carterae.AAC.2
MHAQVHCFAQSHTAWPEPNTYLCVDSTSVYRSANNGVSYAAWLAAPISAQPLRANHRAA